MSVKEKIKQRAVNKHQAHQAKQQAERRSVSGIPTPTPRTRIQAATLTPVKMRVASPPLRTARRGLRKQSTPYSFHASIRQMQQKFIAVRDTIVLPSSAQVRKRKKQFKVVTMTTAGIRQLLADPRLVSFFIFAMCCVILYSAYTNPRFYLNNIQVSGIGYLAQDEVVKASGLQKMHIFDVEPAKVADSIRQLPGVLSAEVEVKWPNITNIIIQEDTPQLVWEENGQSYWVNKKGELIPVIDHTLSLPKISAEPRTFTPFAISQPNMSSSLEEANLVTIKKSTSAYFDTIPVYLLENISRLVAFRPNYTVLRYTEAHGLVYDDPDGWEVYFGTGDNIEYKIAVYEGVRDNLIGRGITFSYINVAHNTVFYMPLSTPDSAGATEEP